MKDVSINIRAQFKKDLNSGKTLQFPGAFNAMVAMLIEENNFDGVYCSGAVASNSLGLPDIGLTTLKDALAFSEPVVQKTNLPVVSDIDTGFEDVGYTIYEFEKIGVAGVHLEDQVDAKLCGHLDGKQLISTSAMVKKVSDAVNSKQDSNFQIIARTDAKSVEGIDTAIDRAKAYVDAGADAIFPEALHNESEMEKFRKAIDVPLLSNMTEFGKTELLTLNQIENLGYNMVIYPVSMQRLAMMAVENGLHAIKESGTQKDIVNQMQTRKRLYEVLRYDYFKKNS
jgi:methylisocitrate lyase